VVLDLGTGDGRGVLRRTRREAGSLVIGVDADVAALRESSARAARTERKGGLPNALFLAAAADELPDSLAGAVDLLTVVLPWGSLLRGLVRGDADLLGALRQTLAPGAELELLLSVQPVDHALGLPLLDEVTVEGLAAAYARAGLIAREARPATSEDVERLGSSWAKRLGVPQRRSAWLLGFTRAREPAVELEASVLVSSDA
jgi:16S rRNA (adenine(1408)-N(1))-methyltransferase